MTRQSSLACVGDSAFRRPSAIPGIRLRMTRSVGDRVRSMLRNEAVNFHPYPLLEPRGER